MNWPTFWLDWVFWIFAAGVAGFILWIWGKMLIAPFGNRRRPVRGSSRNDESWSLMSATSGDTSSMTFSGSDASSSNDSGGSSSDSGGGFESGGGDFGGGGSSGGWND